MPNSDPRDRFFYPTLTLMMDSYSIMHSDQCGPRSDSSLIWSGFIVLASMIKVFWSVWLYTHFSPNGISHCYQLDQSISVLRLLDGIFLFYSNSNFKRNFCKQTAENLIRRHILWRLIWMCIDCRSPTKRKLRLIWFNKQTTFSDEINIGRIRVEFTNSRWIHGTCHQSEIYFPNVWGFIRKANGSLKLRCAICFLKIAQR